MVNKVILIGNVGGDPDVKYFNEGVAVARFSLATTEGYNNKNGERVSQTEWHNIVLWRNLAQVAEKYVKKGMTLYIEGRLRTRSWDDQNGAKRYTTEIYGDSMQMLSRKQEATEKTPETPVSISPVNLMNNDDSDDLPF